MYSRADSGDIPEFPGVSGTYEAPDQADLVLATDRLSVDDSVTRLVELLKARGVFA
jgi:adenylylsulfate kinase-like enzyme